MVIWFLHNNYGPRCCGIIWQYSNDHKPCNFKPLRRLQRLGLGDMRFLYNTPVILLYKSSTRLLTPLPPRLSTWV